MDFQCELKTVPAQPVMTIRTRTPVNGLPQLLGQAFSEILQVVAQQGGHPTGPAYVAYFNMNMDDLDIEIGFLVDKALPGLEKVQPGEIPGGMQASTLYIGPYEDCPPAYEALNAFVATKGLIASGIAYEFYLNDPRQTNEPPQTLIMFPIKP